jgi:phospholipase/carboxylesterase
MRIEKLGGLTVRITGGTDGKGGGHGPVVVLLHGFGAPGDDLVSLGDAMGAPAGTRFIFPEGPLSLNLGFADSRAWWIIDWNRVNQDIVASRLRDLSREAPKGLPAARQWVLSMLKALDRRLAADPKKTILGGFSQGAMLACDVTLRTDDPFAGLVLLSGTLLARDEWAPLMPKRRGLPVFQSHGTQDAILPYLMAERLRDELTQAGLRVDWHGFRGGHEIPDRVVTQLGAFIKGALNRT